MRSLQLLLLLFLTVLSVRPAAGQESPRTFPGFDRGAAVVHVDGRDMALGPGYKAVFAERGVRFTPALGERAERNQTVDLELSEIRRGGGRLVPERFDRPVLEATRAVYERGAGIQERWTATPDGLEFSFLLDELPEGEGDLVVRLGLATTLELPIGPHADGLTLRLDGEPAMRIGDVTAIDATGAAIDGSLAWDGEHLDLVVPGEFVDAAVLPLLIDPLLGGGIDIPGSGTVIGCEASDDGGTILFVWCELFSLSDADIRAQRVLEFLGDLSLIGGPLGIETSASTVATEPDVANPSGSRDWVVVWQQVAGFFAPVEIHGRGVTSDAVLTSTLQISESGNSRAPQVAGNLGGNGNTTAVVVWEQGGLGIRMRKVDLGPFNDPAFTLAGDVLSVAGGTLLFEPAISRTEGEGGRYLIGWREFFSGSPGDSDLYLRAYEEDLTPVTPITTVAVTIGPDESSISIDGDGDTFCIAYQSRAFLDANTVTIQARLVEVGPSTLSIGPPVDLDTGSNDRLLFDPEVLDNGYFYAVSFGLRIQFSGIEIAEQLVTHLIDPYTLATGAVLSQVAEFADDDPEPATCSLGDRFVAPTTAITVGGQTSSDLTSPDELFVNHYANPAGITNLGGAPFVIDHTCGLAITGQPFFTELEGAQPLSLAFLMLGFNQVSLPCTTQSSVIVDPGPPTIGTPMTTNADGGAVFQTAIPDDPSLEGLVFATQWFVFNTTSGCEVVPGTRLQLSDALEHTVLRP